MLQTSPRSTSFSTKEEIHAFPQTEVSQAAATKSSLLYDSYCSARSATAVPPACRRDSFCQLARSTGDWGICMPRLFVIGQLERCAVLKRMNSLGGELRLLKGTRFLPLSIHEGMQA